MHRWISRRAYTTSALPNGLPIEGSRNSAARSDSATFLISSALTWCMVQWSWVTRSKTSALVLPYFDKRMQSTKLRWSIHLYSLVLRSGDPASWWSATLACCPERTESPKPLHGVATSASFDFLDGYVMLMPSEPNNMPLAYGLGSTAKRRLPLGSVLKAKQIDPYRSTVPALTEQQRTSDNRSPFCLGYKVRLPIDVTSVTGSLSVVLTLPKNCSDLSLIARKYTIPSPSMMSEPSRSLSQSRTRCPLVPQKE